ncbi:DUF4303 domain-containing protein [Mycolicibacterium mageritense]|uniref:DUF4303 domain-containing protein n=1 Tax=Mycolicibacterium mageritense TaxID=53462 RepID=UPI001E3B636E|nr:DUF4303 domain-containing protein [Mycolicibacterium mageritense]GJJ21037.1 hypothetical protein MTY414_47100 [Mycolicibacterium mageritense]
MEFDWDGFVGELTAAASDAVRAMVDVLGERPYAVAFSGFYAETTGVIYLPNLAFATEESVEDADCRFSPPDWEHQDYEWAETDARWGERLSAAVTGLPRAQWEQAWGRFAEAILTIAARTRAALVADGTVAPDVVVFVDDEPGELLVRSVTPEELRLHFPDYAAAADAERAVAAMPVEQRVQALATPAGLVAGPPQALGRDRAIELLLDAGAAAVPVGIAALAHPDTAWAGAKLLADLAIATPDVMDALWAALPLRANAHDWVATALGRLGAGSEVLARRDLPASSRAAAVAAPYTSFRDQGRGWAPLDYSLLAAGLADPSIAAAVTEELRPGRGYCTPDAADIPGARLGLDHPEPVIRRHAVIVVGELIGPMGPDDVDPDELEVLRQRISDAATGDSDAEVRRLAGYSCRV